MKSAVRSGWLAVMAMTGIVVEAGGQVCTTGPISLGGMPGVDARVYAAVTWDPDDDGPAEPWLVLGGAFMRAGDIIAPGIVAWDGEFWHALGTGLEGRVAALAVYQGSLYAGGDFLIPGTTAHGIARWDGMAWQPLGPGLDGGQYYDHPTVDALSVYEDTLIVGGGFYVDVGGELLKSVARWNGVAWSALGGGLPIEPSLSRVRDFAVFDGQLYAGGDTGVGVRRWDGFAWQYFDGAPDSNVNALAVFEDRLIVGGSLFHAGALTPAQNIAAWDGSTWAALPGGEPFPVAALLVVGDTLLAGGDCGFDCGALGVGLARWTSGNWYALDTAPWGDVLALAEFEGRIVVGGGFTSVNRTALHVATTDLGGVDWRALTRNVDAPVSAAGLFGDRLVVGGSFAHAGAGTNLSNVAAWDGAAWHALSPGLIGYPGALVQHGAELIAAGSFIYDDHFTTLNYVGAWDGTAWHSLAGGMDNAVIALASHGPDLYAGGQFATAGGVAAPRIARWDGANWHALGSGIPGIVFAVLPYAGEIVAAGQFQTAGDVPARNIAAWNGTTWRPLGDGIGVAAYSAVEALAIYEGDLIAGGQFMDASGTPAAPVARWDGVQWSPMGTPAGPVRVRALTVFDGMLFASGPLVPGGPVARWNGTAWESVDAGIPSSARPQSLVGYRGQLFISAGHVAWFPDLPAGDWFLTRWGCTTAPIACPGDVNCDGVVTFADIDPFVAALQTPGGAAWSWLCPWQQADVNGDTDVSFGDIDPFVARLGAGCP